MQVILSALSNFKNDWIFFKGDIGGFTLGRLDYNGA